MSFLNPKEKILSHRFIKKGFLVFKTQKKKDIYFLRNLICDRLNKLIPRTKSRSKDFILNNFHQFINKDNLNEIRVNLIQHINKNKNFKNKYYNIAENELCSLVGNELVMQKNINLSIQLPNDESSLLPIHSDVWSGDSPYEVVQWVPLVNCYNTKSMFILKSNKLEDFIKKFRNNKTNNSIDFYKEAKLNLIWIKINFGEVLLFNQILPHGNIINLEKETRWSMNCRYKSVFSPYADKKLGEFFEPITLRPITKLAQSYVEPIDENT